MTNEERKVFELALEALLKTQNEGFNLPGSAIREAITAIKEALAQPKEPDQDEVDIRSRLYQRIHELECVLKDIAEYTGEGPPTTDWQGIVNLISDSARNALEDKEIKQPEQEPVGQLLEDAFGRGQVMWFNKPKDESMLYTTPPQRPWVGLTEEDIDDAEIHLTSCRNNHESWIEGIQEFAQAIEAKLKEKNNA